MKGSTAARKGLKRGDQVEMQCKSIEIEIIDPVLSDLGCEWGELPACDDFGEGCRDPHQTDSSPGKLTLCHA